MKRRIKITGTVIDQCRCARPGPCGARDDSADDEITMVGVTVAELTRIERQLSTIAVSEADIPLSAQLRTLRLRRRNDGPGVASTLDLVAPAAPLPSERLIGVLPM